MSWNQLLEMLREKEKQPESKYCPQCGKMLMRIKQGLWCSFCGFLK